MLGKSFSLCNKQFIIKWVRSSALMMITRDDDEDDDDSFCYYECRSGVEKCRLVTLVQKSKISIIKLEDR